MTVPLRRDIEHLENPKIPLLFAGWSDPLRQHFFALGGFFRFHASLFTSWNLRVRALWIPICV